MLPPQGAHRFDPGGRTLNKIPHAVQYGLKPTKQNNQKKDGWARGEGGLDKGGQRHKFPVIRQISTRDVMYMINIINIAVCYI